MSGYRDSATTSALTSFPGFANRAASFRTVSQAATKRCLPELRYARLPASRGNRKWFRDGRSVMTLRVQN